MHFFASLFAAIASLFASLFGAVPAVHTPVSATTTQAVSASAGAPAGTAAAHTSSLNLHAIPLGDGKISTSPEVGYVYSCQQSFNGGGAEHAGAWIQGSTWDETAKISVAGSVSWPNAVFRIAVSGDTRTITSNGLPVNATTGMFPIQRSDPAYQYDRNPNSVKAQTIDYALPASPQFAASPSCLPMGAIGIALNGVAIYNALDDSGRDAVAHEVQDSCDGHPQGAGQYHYHGPSVCMPNVNKDDTVVGYALDGFPITSLYDASGHEYTDADLDACHGTTGTYTDENGKTQNGYHYVLTQEYPYTLGCFRGTPVRSAPARGAGASGGQPSRNGPPQAAIDACTGKTSGASCSMSQTNGICRTTPSGTFACVPQ